MRKDKREIKENYMSTGVRKLKVYNESKHKSKKTKGKENEKL